MENTYVDSNNENVTFEQRKRKLKNSSGSQRKQKKQNMQHFAQTNEAVIHQNVFQSATQTIKTNSAANQPLTTVTFKVECSPTFLSKLLAHQEHVLIKTTDVESNKGGNPQIVLQKQNSNVSKRKQKKHPSAKPNKATSTTNQLITKKKKKKFHIRQKDVQPIVQEIIDGFTGVQLGTSSKCLRELKTHQKQDCMATHPSISKKSIDDNAVEVHSETSVKIENVTPQRNPANSSCTTNNYNEVANRHLQVAIIDKSNNCWCKITKPQAELLYSELERMLDTYLFALPENATPPIFNSWSYVEEIFKVACMDDNSLMWLREAVGNLPQLWDAAHLEIINEDQLPHLLKMEFCIMGPPDDLDVVLQRLKVQNPWANIAQWHLLHSDVKNEPQGRLLIFAITDCIKDTIVNNGGKLFHKLTSICPNYGTIS